jgi:RND family efflux transporter MFP subunit
METAKAKYDRLMQLRSRGSVSTEDTEISSGDYRAAVAEHANQMLLTRAGLATVGLKQAELASSRLKLAETKVLAPTPTRPVPGAEEGVSYAVVARGVAEGTMIRAGTEVCRLVIDRTIKLRAPVPERFSDEIRAGQKVEVSTATSKTPFEGRVTRINPAVEPATRTFDVEIQVPNPTGAIKAGGFGKAAILTRRDAGAATVPLSAPYSFAGTTRVFLVENGKAKEVPVTLGVQSTEWVEIASPKLPHGAQVVTSGQSTLAEGTRISVRETLATKPAVDPPPSSAERARSGG